MDQAPLVPEKTLPAKPLAGLFVVLFVVTVIGGWLYVDSVRNELEMKITELEARPLSAPTTPSAPSTPSAPAAEVPQNAPVTPPAAPVKPVFNASTVKVGDKVGAWTVTNIEKDASGRPLRVTLAGSATVSGRYSYWPEGEPFFGGQVIFTFDEESSILLPAASTMLGAKIFGFSDNTRARSLFGPEGSNGSATIEISSYTVTLIVGEAWDTVGAFEVAAP